MSTYHFAIAVGLSILCVACHTEPIERTDDEPPKIYRDTAFMQDYSIKYNLADPNTELISAGTDRNGVIQVLSSAGMMQLQGGQFLFPGRLVADQRYRTSSDKRLAALQTCQEQFILLDDEAVLSHAWAGKVFERHQLPKAQMLAGAPDRTFLISDGQSLQLLQHSAIAWTIPTTGTSIVDIQYLPDANRFAVLLEDRLVTVAPNSPKLQKIFTDTAFTAFTYRQSTGEYYVGTSNGYWIIDAQSGKPKGDKHTTLPAPTITAMEVIDGQVWIGSTQGAYRLRSDGRYDYYFGRRWLPGDRVVDLSKGPDRTVLILTGRGIGHLHFRRMTLYDKAVFYDRQVRQRHIRLGFNASLGGMTDGDVTGGYLSDSDNDGLWTAMYLGAEAFRYAVTGEADALQNCRESLEAMERLYTINPVPGFPSRSFERSGYIDQLADPHRWQHASDPEWDWKATTSSDEAIGHIFAFGVVAELIDEPVLKDQAIALIDTLMQHILDNDLYLVDYNGQPTRWGRWHPDYVNGFPTSVGDRKLNSSNVIGMLQTAYHFTGKDHYRDRAFELMEKHGYLDNLMRPMKEIGKVGEEGDPLSQMLSDGWNHSDDEMYFLGYWGLYRYAFNDSLRTLYRASIIDHWQTERPEKDGAWNILTAMTGLEDPDLDAAAWYLREYPLDLVHWSVANSHRKDIEKIAPNFRGQSTQEVLPPDELPIARHNANRFRLDGGNGGRSEYSAGDIWLLPYWAGRYFGVIAAP